ncbi:MAG TPA: hypothetical protein VI894_00790 [Candidatus Nanoarchaeia archaeon]|nr:hypothetical protein [Candidatus Nanoarchaeia archaeon]
MRQTGAIFSIIFLSAFLFSAVLIITNFTTVDKASWLMDGFHIVIGILLIFLGSTLLRVYMDTRKKNILYLAIGFLVLAFGRLITLYIQEYIVSSNATVFPAEPVLFSSVSQTLGVIFVFFGFKELISRGKK